VPLAGRAMFEYSLEACLAAQTVGPIVIAVPPGHLGGFSEIVEAMGAEVAPGQGDGEASAGRPAVLLTEGGATRSQSVAAGLELIDSELVVVHDAARPLVTPGLIDAAVATLEAAPDVDAVIAAAAVTDTIKRVDAGDMVEETLDRTALRSVQTPQVFRREALVSAIAIGDLESATDDASLIEANGGSVAVLDAPSFNIKVTVPEDMVRAGVVRAKSN
jgi:2-C-methyl-D-erythritol 4-phosphate cytidylyltransferase